MSPRNLLIQGATGQMSCLILTQIMKRLHCGMDISIDWESVFERIIGSSEPPLSHFLLSRHLAQTCDDLGPDSAWSRVLGASDEGELFLIVVERFPGVYRKYHFVPRKRFTDAGRAFLPFWSYVYEDILNGDGWFDRSELYTQVRERSRGDVPEWAIDAIDEYLPELTPATEHTQSMRNTSIRSDTKRLYEQLSDVAGPSEGKVTLPHDRERKMLNRLHNDEI